MKQQEKILPYGSGWTEAARWWKAFFLFPPWAFLLLPVLGYVTGFFGTFVFQIGYLFALVLGGTYFFDDCLRSRLLIDENRIRFGLTKYPLNELSSVGLSYHRNKSLPSDLILYFGAGKSLEIGLARLKFEQLETLINFIENRLPQCEIDPVVLTLLRSKSLARRAALEEFDRTIIPYHSRRGFQELLRIFQETGERWTLAGPIVLSVLTAPFWLWVVRGVYEGHRDLDNDRLILVSKAAELMAGAESVAANQLAKGVEWLPHLVSHPVMLFFLTVCVIPLFYYIGRHFLLPNSLLLNQIGIYLGLSGHVEQFPFLFAKWSDVASATIVRPSATAGPDSWRLSLSDVSGKEVFSANLAAIQSEDRLRLSKAFEKWAPQCVVETELAEALIPRQARSYTELWLQSLSAPPERASLNPLTSGQTLQNGQYEVVRKLGVGGQGAAYQCVSTDTRSTHRQVVLKETIIPVFVDASIRRQALERFEQEASILRNLDSEHIVKLLDYFVEDHRGYLVLELIEGRSLRQTIETKGAMKPDVVLDLAKQMCEILAYLHDQSVIHRDFTPDNLMLQSNGKLKLIDFNVAQSKDEGSAGMVVGKQSYIPPEQFRGKPTPQSDIYAMGATLYFILTGEDPEPISQSKLPDVTSDAEKILDQLIWRATALDSKKRVSTISEIFTLLNDDNDTGHTINLKKSEPAVEIRVEKNV